MISGQESTGIPLCNKGNNISNETCKHEIQYHLRRVVPMQRGLRPRLLIIAFMAASMLLKFLDYEAFSPFLRGPVSVEDVELYRIDHDLFSNNDSQIPIVMYNYARCDRSGSVIHDLLMAHAYSFHHNITYGGACFPRTSRYLPFFPRRNTVRLLQDLNWTKEVYFACPKRGIKTKHEIFVKNYPYERELFTNEWKEHFIQQTGTFQSIYQKSNKRTSDGVFHMAVHVRRGDVEPCVYGDRYQSNAHFLRLIDHYRSVAYEQGWIKDHQILQITIFSESLTYEQFDVFHQANYTVQLDKPLSDVWKALIAADILIMSNSRFSYVPALLNQNKVVYSGVYLEREVPKDWLRVDKQLLELANEEAKAMKEDACRRQTIYDKMRVFYKNMRKIRKKKA